MKRDITFPFLPPSLLPPHMLAYSQNTRRQLNKILEAPVCFQVYFGVGGDFSLRLHSPFLLPKCFSSYKHSKPFGREGGGDIFPALKCLDKDLLSTSLQLFLGLI